MIRDKFLLAKKVFIGKKKISWVIILAVVISFLCVDIYIASKLPLTTGDEAYRYSNLAVQLAEKGQIPSIGQYPLRVWLQAGIYLLCRKDLMAVDISNKILLCLVRICCVAVLLIMLVKEIKRPWATAIGAMFFLLWSILLHTYMAGINWLFLLFLLTTVYFLGEAVRNSGPTAWVLTGLSLATAVLVRLEALVTIIPICLFLIMRCMLGQKHWGKNFKNMTILLFTFAGPLIMYWLLSGLLIGDMQMMALSPSPCGVIGYYHPDIFKKVGNISIIRLILIHPLLFFTIIFRNVSIFTTKIVLRKQNIPFLMTGALGLLIAWRSLKDRTQLLAWGLLMLFLNIYFIFGIVPRFILLFYFCALYFSAYGISKLMLGESTFSWLKGRRALVAAGALICCMMLLYFPFVLREFRRITQIDQQKQTVLYARTYVQDADIIMALRNNWRSFAFAAHFPYQNVYCYKSPCCESIDDANKLLKKTDEVGQIYAIGHREILKDMFLKTGYKWKLKKKFGEIQLVSIQ